MVNEHNTAGAGAGLGDGGADPVLRMAGRSAGPSVSGLSPSGVSPAGVAPAAEAVGEGVPTVIDPERLIAFFPCAAAAWSKANPHHMSHSLHKRGGYLKFLSGKVLPAIHGGFQRLFFHLPFGKATGQSPYSIELRAREEAMGRPWSQWTKQEQDDLKNAGYETWHMSIDAKGDLERTGNGHIFDEAMQVFTWLNSMHPEVEVFVYVGSYDGEEARRLEEGRFGEMIARWWDSLAPLVDLPNVSPVFDAAVGKDEDHPNARMVQICHGFKARQGRAVGVEASIQKAKPWPNELGCPCIAWEATWLRQRHDRNLPRAEIRGEVIRVLDGMSSGVVERDFGGDEAEHWTAAARRIAAEGCTPAVQVWGGPLKGVKAADLAAEISRPAKGGAL